VARSLYERARRLARDVHRECGADAPHKIDPFAIVGRRNIAVRYGKLEGATARIFHCDGRAVIRISDSIVQEGRLRFSVAHEVGHFLLGHTIPSQRELDGKGPPYSRYQEREADAFASEHNMPEAFVRPYSEAACAAITAVRTIAHTFRASIVASAVRYVELSGTPCAVAYSERGRVLWAKHSRAFPARIPRQMTLGPASLASEYHARGVLDTSVRVLAGRAWFGSMSRVADQTLVEHAELIPEPGWGGVLSLLTVHDDSLVHRVAA
jgi:Zn-dependent peptidase ImmA (M78 family)